MIMRIHRRTVCGVVEPVKEVPPLEEIRPRVRLDDVVGGKSLRGRPGEDTEGRKEAHRAAGRVVCGVGTRCTRWQWTAEDEACRSRPRPRVLAVRTEGVRRDAQP